MKILVIGLGSMGKRRVRNLIALKQKNIAGFDVLESRTNETKQKYTIEVFNDFEDAIDKFQPDIFIISTPPDYHMHYANFAAENNIHCFIEASVIDAEKILKLSEAIKGKNLLIAPSCTMKFFPGPKKIKELIAGGVIGKVLNFNYHTGQYLPDWHPWEEIKDFYVSNKHTGGCREIVPFELTWLNDLWGNPEPIACLRGKLTDMEAEIEDVYHCLLRYPGNVYGNLTVEVISRPIATRELRILGSSGEIVFSGESNLVKYTNTDMTSWHEYSFEPGSVEKQYINPEEPYIDEIRVFLEAVVTVNSGKVSIFPNTLLDDYNILQVLYKLEDISEGLNGLSR